MSTCIRFANHSPTTTPVQQLHRSQRLRRIACRHNGCCKEHHPSSPRLSRSQTLAKDSARREHHSLQSSSMVRNHPSSSPFTPLSPPSRSLSRRSRIFLKLENLQPSGSFKSRGLGNLVLQSMERANDPEKVHFYASSGGNAGLGCVYGANFVGRPVTVCFVLSFVDLFDGF